MYFLTATWDTVDPQTFSNPVGNLKSKLFTVNHFSNACTLTPYVLVRNIKALFSMLIFSLLSSSSLHHLYILPSGWLSPFNIICVI